jgi:prepilin-type processing-associated H-X9-DG protein
MNHTRATSLCVLLTCAALTGCALDAQTPAQPAGSPSVQQQALWATSANVLWADGRVPVCFQPRSPEHETDDDYLRMIDRYRTLTESVFETLPNTKIDFYGWQKCRDGALGSLPGELRVIVNPNGNGNWAARHCELGAEYPLGDKTTCYGGAGYRADRESAVLVNGIGYDWGDPWDTAVLHEMAHILGFHHEQGRIDNDDPSCRPEDPTDDGLFVTTFDTGSILNGTYCGNWTPLLSPMDEVGLEITYYGGGFEQGVDGLTSLHVNGSLLVRRNDAIVTDWTLRGASPEAYTGTVRFTRAGTTRAAMSYPASLLPSGTSTIAGSFVDLFGRTHTLESGRFSVDDRKHAALLRVVL